MSALGSRARSHWIIPAVAAIGVAIAVTVPATTSDAAPKLPAKSAQELLTEILSAKPVPLSGTVDYEADLGLPDLGSAAASPVDLLTGSGTMQVWADPKVGARASIKGQTSEFTTVATPTDLWAYSSSQNAAWHADVSKVDHGDQKTPSTLPTPADAAKQVVAAVEPSTKLAVDDNVRIAGRSAYQLTLTPKTSNTLIASVRIAVDADNSTPLRLQVWSTQNSATPAWQMGFASISFATPSAQTFAFTPPAGADVTQLPLGTHERKGEMRPPTVSGQDWTTVLTFHDLGALDPALLGAKDSASSDSQGDHSLVSPPPGHGGQVDIAGLLAQLGQTVPEGTIYATSLLTVLVTTDGDLLIGAVPAATLQQAAQN